MSFHPGFSLNRREFLRVAALGTVAASFSSGLAQTDKKVTLAFVGVAHIHTPGFVSLIKTRPDVVVKAVWDHEAARAEKAAKELGAQSVKDVKQIWNDAQINAVVICSETNRHHDLVLAAAKSGKICLLRSRSGSLARKVSPWRKRSTRRSCSSRRATSCAPIRSICF